VIALGSLASDADIKLFGVIDSFGFTAANMAEREDISFVGVAVDDPRERSLRFVGFVVACRKPRPGQFARRCSTSAPMMTPVSGYVEAIARAINSSSGVQPSDRSSRVGGWPA
jgi:hypothetical protein